MGDDPTVMGLKGFGPGAADSNAFLFENPDDYRKRISQLPANWGAMTPAQHQAYWDNYFSKNGANAGAQQARATDTYNQSQNEQAQQQALIASLQAQAAGNGPSLAQGQLQAGTDLAQRNSMALGSAQQAQGLGTQSALLAIGNQNAAQQQQAAGQSAQIRSTEQLQAQGQLAGLLGQTRAQDLGYSGGADNLSRGYTQDETAQDNRAADMALGAVGKAGQAATTIAAAAHGGLVPGDDLRNDVVPAMLSPGEVVLPRSVTQSDDPAAKAAAFIEAIKAQRRSRGPM